MEPLSEIEKNIFNCHLVATRSNMGKPFKLRKNFNNLTDSTVFHLQRLSNFFKKFPEIDMREFFNAPYSVYKTKEHYDLSYYASPKAVKSYSLYKKQKDLVDLDLQYEEVKRSLQFIGDFCTEHELTWGEYVNQSDIPLWLVHVKENHISPVVLFAIPNIVDKVTMIGPELTEFYLGEFGLDIRNQKLHYLKSQKIKPYIEKIIPKLIQILEK